MGPYFRRTRTTPLRLGDFFGDMYYATIWAEFPHPPVAQDTRYRFVGERAHQDVEIIHHAPSEIDEKLVAAVGRHEASDDDTCHVRVRIYR